MIINGTRRFRPSALVSVVALLLALTPLCVAQVATTQVTTRDRNTNIRSVPSGSKLKFKGVVISRDADVFTIRDRTRTDYAVRMTDQTSIKTHGGFLRSGKRYPVTDILAA